MDVQVSRAQDAQERSALRSHARGERVSALRGCIRFAYSAARKPATLRRHRFDRFRCGARSSARVHGVASATPRPRVQEHILSAEERFAVVVSA